MATGRVGSGPTVAVWWARTGRHDWAGLVPLLDAGERGRLEALRRPEDRERFVLAAALARAALASRLGVPARAVALERGCARCGKPHGRPRLASPAAAVELSITHSGGAVGVAVCDGVPVGLDVEEVGRMDGSARLEAGVLAAGERRALDRAVGGAADGPVRVEAFLRLWTRKEALTKMVGTGVTAPLAEVVVSGPGEPARCLAMPGGRPWPDELSLHDVDPPVPGHVGAVAAGHPAAQPSAGDGDALVAALLA